MRAITVEGPDGVGKTTLLKGLRVRFQAARYPVEVFKDPGSTAVGEHVREFLLRKDRSELDHTAELLLFQALKHELVARCVHPALRRGNWVFVDRGSLSTVVYQGLLRDAFMPKFMPLFQATSPAEPDLYLMLQATPEELIARSATRSEEATFYETQEKLRRMPEAYRMACGWTKVPVIEISGMDAADTVLDNAVMALKHHFGNELEELK